MDPGHWVELLFPLFSAHWKGFPYGYALIFFLKRNAVSCYLMAIRLQSLYCLDIMAREGHQNFCMFCRHNVPA